MLPRTLSAVATSMLRCSPVSSSSSSSSSSRSTHSAAMQQFVSHLQTEISNIKAAGTFKSERIITSQQSNTIGVSGRTEKVLNFCANNYLGLANQPFLLNAAKKSIDSHGLGLASVRFICGTQDIHKELEKKIAKFHGTEDAILYASCFDANAGVFETLLGPEDAVISDTLNHASIIDGIRLCKAKRLRYEHMNLNDLEKQLQDAQSSRFRLIVTDGVFSMDGHIAPLKEIVLLAEKYNSMVFIDECHATGFFGKTGRGTPEYTGTEGKIDIINSTLGKALGGATGGYTTGKKEIIDLLRQRSRPYLFSNTIPPAIVGASIACFDYITSNSSLAEKLQLNTFLFRKLMGENGFDLAGSKDHPIVPIMLYDAKLAGDFAEEMLKRGIYVIGFSFPVVPKGQARIRTQISAAHTEDDLKRAVKAFVEVRDKLCPELDLRKKKVQSKL